MNNTLPRFILEEPFLVECARVAAPLGIDFNEKPKKGELDTLADNYCEALDQITEFESMDQNLVDATLYTEAIKKREMNFGALAIRFWKSMKNLYDAVHKTYAASDFSKDDLPATFSARLNKACKYRAWQRDPEAEPTEVRLNKAGEVDQRFTKTKKKLNAQQCINMVINTHFYELTGGKMFYDNKKANLLTTSMDTVIGSDKDGNSKTIGDTLADENSCPTALGNGISVEMVVASYFKANKPDIAIIIDAIVHLTEDGLKKFINDDFSKVRSYINHLDENSAKLYAKKYSTDTAMISNTINTFHKYNRVQLDTCISEIRNTLRAAF